MYSTGSDCGNTPSANSESVAEFTVSMMLALSRKISMFDTLMRQSDFTKSLGTSLLHKTLGLIGFGNIGKQVVKILQGFDMHILVYDVYKDEEFANKYNCNFVPLDILLKKSDFITIHVPLLEEQPI
jgi:D-3-phosphoglycerate dehydrogenase